MINFIEILKEHKIAPSLQRIKILEYLHNYKTHPTADMIYKALIDEIPTLSKTTVYNTLKTFVEKGILAELSLFENEVRYEYNTEPHIHFKCVNCGKIFDISASYECLKNKDVDGHKVLEHHVNLKGICKNCRKKER
ncbi:MAG TPA: transcriptional repressor [Candidatus Cloacimonetes bacterium]|nr:transcriptional repressor [Candidatus Cloacimonadota bacterium]